MINRIQLREVNSTNRYAIEKKGAIGLPACIIAEYQSEGKGQGKKIWISKPGKNLLMSFVFQPMNLEAYRSFYISKIAALSIAEIMQNYLKGVSIKWPNDILVENRKIAGILIENSIKGKLVENSIMGCGINVNQEEFPHFSNSLEATSIVRETGNKSELSGMLEDLLAVFQRWIHELDIGNYELIDQHYHNLLYLRGQWAHYSTEKEEHEARITEVEEDGHLAMETREGQRLRFAFGEVSFQLKG